MKLAEALATIGVKPGASREEARAAYRRRAQLLHPDRHASASQAVRAEADKAMADLTEAWAAIDAAGTTIPRQGMPAPEDEVRFRAAGPTECVVCGAHPAAPVTYRRVTGMVIAWSLATWSETVCRVCSRSLFRDAQYKTLTRGWWGAFAFLRTVVAVLQNLAAFRLHARLAPPAGRDPSVVSLLPWPLPLPRATLARPGAWLATAVACGIATVVVVGVLSNQSGSTSGSTRVRAATDDLPLVQRTAEAVGRCVDDEARFIGCSSAAAVARVVALSTTPSTCDDLNAVAAPLRDDSGFACLSPHE